MKQEKEKNKGADDTMKDLLFDSVVLEYDNARLEVNPVVREILE